MAKARRTATDTTPFLFEDALARLENLVSTLESGALPLEEALKTFEQGVRLTRECQQALEQAEQRVQQLLTEGDGFRLTPLNDDSDEA